MTTEKTATPPLEDESVEQLREKLISREAYIEDIKTRWKIHKLEIRDLMDDIKKMIDFLSPIIKDAFNKAKDWIKKLKK